MNRKTYCHHTRDFNTGQKLMGGTFSAVDNAEAYSQAARGLRIALGSMGSPVFVDEQGRRVFLYLSIHPEFIDRGPAEIAALRKAKAEAEEAARIASEQREAEVAALVDEIGEEEATRILRAHRDAVRNS